MQKIRFIVWVFILNISMLFCSCFSNDATAEKPALLVIGLHGKGRNASDLDSIFSALEKKYESGANASPKQEKPLFIKLASRVGKTEDCNIEEQARLSIEELKKNIMRYNKIQPKELE